MSKGVFYIASGESYISDAERSAKSLKRHNPSVPISIYCDGNPDNDIFDHVFPLKTPINDMGDSILSEEHFPYTKNLYLDVDTHICGDLDPIFKILETFDFAIAQSAGVVQRNKIIYDRMGLSIPDTFPECNSGVIGFTDSKNVKCLLDRWNQIYYDTDFGDIGFKTNQPALTGALLKSEVDFTILPQEYNFQLDLNRFARDKIKILHKNGGTKINMSKFEAKANSFTNSRVISLEDYPCRTYPANYRPWKYKLKKITSKDTYKRIKREAKKEQNKEGGVSVIKFLAEKFRHFL